MNPILFPSGLDASLCAAKLRRIGKHPYARNAIRMVGGQCKHVVLLIGETIMQESDA